jgi:hypothetical protein
VDSWAKEVFNDDLQKRTESGGEIFEKMSEILLQRHDLMEMWCQFQQTYLDS